jgi:beta-lactamase superfamily II metal-dependent hydrolase
MQRYRDGEVRLLRTDRDGAIRLRLRAQGVSVDTARESNRRYWHGR